jgi:hypothetical protein
MITSVHHTLHDAQAALERWSRCGEFMDLARDEFAQSVLHENRIGTASTIRKTCR